MEVASPTGIAPVLQLHPTRRCNLACAHCYTSSGPRVQEELHLELLLDSLEDAFSLGYCQLAVSGGEPLVYAPLPDLLAHARMLGMLTTVTTNGMLATERRWKALAPLIDVLAISIDGTAEEHDAIRCRRGAFARTVANLDVIRASGVPFGFIYTLTQYNADSLEFVVRLAAEHGARSVQVHPLTLHGRAASEMSDARPDSIELVAALCEASRLGRELGIVVHVDAVTIRQLAGFRDYLVPRRPVWNLVDVAPVLIVEADASVVPLTHEVSRPSWLGTLSDGRLSALARNWIKDGHADLLAVACERTWDEITRTCTDSAVYWYEEVAARTFGARSKWRTFSIRPGLSQGASRSDHGHPAPAGAEG